MPVLPHDRYETLADLLEARYDDLQDDPVPLRYGDIAAAIGYTDSYVGGLHRGRANTAVAKWRGSMAVDFLRAYRFTTQEVREIAQRYDLHNVLEYFELKDANTPARVKEGGHKVRFLGAVSAGRFRCACSGTVYVRCVDVATTVVVGSSTEGGTAL